MKIATKNSVTIPMGEIAFYNNYIPTIKAGNYQVTIESEIQGIDTEGYFAKPLQQQFEVRGIQFTLPSNEVHAVYPAHHSNGSYGKVMPHMVLNKRVLPWERSLDEKDLDKEHAKIPWMCLLVFKEGEITIDATTSTSRLITTTVKEFLAADPTIIKPAIDTTRVDADVLASTCQSIQISGDVFKNLVPRKEELKYLAHVRQVNTDHQVLMDPDDQGWYSVVIGNRLLQADKTATRYYVHLVSLEGLVKYLGPKAVIDKPTIQLISLYNWTFVSQPEQGESFADLVGNFTKAPDLLLRRHVDKPVNPDPATQEAWSRLQNGYMPINYETATGENTFAWYRGPLTPVIPPSLPRPNEDHHFPSASSVMIYDSSKGIFDQSYAAAWTLGRMLALADPGFGQALLRYRRKAYQLVGKLYDYLKEKGITKDTDLQQIINSKVVRDAFDKSLSNLSTSLTTMLAQLVPHAPQKQLSTNTPVPLVPLTPVEITKRFLATPSIQALLKQEVEADIAPIAQWLARKQLLYDVPFQYLVPDSGFLPVESLRFFYVDQDWLDILADGALSIGVQTFKDTFLHQIMRGVINDATILATRTLRAQLQGKSTGDIEAGSKKEAMSGILIRSALIAGWPGLEVKAYKTEAAKEPQRKPKEVLLKAIKDACLGGLMSKIG